MDEPSLHDLLERATVPEPPIGPVAQNALRAGLRLRRRRHAWYTATGATVAVACAAALAVTATTARQAPATARNASTIYVLSRTQKETMVTPVPAATGKPGEPFRIGLGGPPIAGIHTALSPDGKTIWVSGGSVVTSFSTATDTAGKRITIPAGYGVTEELLITPDEKTVYVLSVAGELGTITPISTATGRPGKSIVLGIGYLDMGLTPDGKTLYALYSGFPSSHVIPISTSSNKPGKPIRLGIAANAIVVPPDGHTAYAVGSLDADAQKPGIEPIATVTNTPGSPIGFGAAGIFFGIAIAPDGHAIYIALRSNAGTYEAIPFFTASDTLGKMISLPATISGQGILAATPDGRTIYVGNIPPQSTRRVSEETVKKGYCPDTVVPIMTATGAAGNPFHTCFPASVVFSQDGRTAYISSAGGAPSGQSVVMSAATATGHQGKSFTIEGQAVAMVIAP
jgi:DNA-binding beta-propeller fold protein YncE